MDNKYKIKLCFSLFEILIAVTVISICFVVILSAVSLNIKNTAIAEGYTTASLLAKTKLVELLNKDKFLTGDENGDFGSDYPNFSWEQNIKIIENPAEPAFDSDLLPSDDLSSDENKSKKTIDSSANNVKSKKYLFLITLIVKFNYGGQDRDLTFKTVVYETEEINV